jgi:hypothetical protein
MYVLWIQFGAVNVRRNESRSSWNPFFAGQWYSALLRREKSHIGKVSDKDGDARKISVFIIFSEAFIFLKCTQWQCILSYDNSTAVYVYKDLKTLHPDGIRTRDVLFDGHYVKPPGQNQISLIVPNILECFTCIHMYLYVAGDIQRQYGWGAYNSLKAFSCNNSV